MNCSKYLPCSSHDTTCPVLLVSSRPSPRVPTPSGGTLIPYMLDEGRNWALDMASLRNAVSNARRAGKAVRGLVFINPGNPTGEKAATGASCDPWGGLPVAPGWRGLACPGRLRGQEHRCL
jgi:hypothetical protein